MRKFALLVASLSAFMLIGVSSASAKKLASAPKITTYKVYDKTKIVPVKVTKQSKIYIYRKTKLIGKATSKGKKINIHIKAISANTALKIKATLKGHKTATKNVKVIKSTAPILKIKTVKYGSTVVTGTATKSSKIAVKHGSTILGKGNATSKGKFSIKVKKIGSKWSIYINAVNPTTMGSKTTHLTTGIKPTTKKVVKNPITVTKPVTTVTPPIPDKKSVFDIDVFTDKYLISDKPINLYSDPQMTHAAMTIPYGTKVQVGNDVDQAEYGMKMGTLPIKYEGNDYYAYSGVFLQPTGFVDAFNKNYVSIYGPDHFTDVPDPEENAWWEEYDVFNDKVITYIYESGQWKVW